MFKFPRRKAGNGPLHTAGGLLMFGALMGLLMGGVAVAGMAAGGGEDEEDIVYVPPGEKPNDKQPVQTPPAVSQPEQAEQQEAPEDPPVTEEHAQAPAPQPPVAEQQEAGQEDPVVVEAPTPQPAPAPTPTPTPVVDTDGPDSGDSVGISDGSAISVVEGRVATLDPASSGDDIVSLRILSGPEHGNVTVNPDNTLALVLTGTTHVGALDFTYEATMADGSSKTVTQALDVTKSPQPEGWGTGDAYMLRTDENGDVIVETGENHQALHISGRDDALNRADIAALEGVDKSVITNEWLIDHPEYGGSPDMALSKWTGTDVWKAMQKSGDPNSNWLLMERGYEYTDVADRLFVRNMQGEDELHPIHITAFGDGAQPVFTELPRMYQDPSSNVVVSDIHFTAGVQIIQGSNILLEDITLTGEGLMNIQNVDGFTLRDSDIWDIRYEEAPEGRENWWAHTDRTQGLYLNGNHKVLIENNLFDHNGWADDYREDASTEGGQAPSQYSQNVYINYDNFGVTFRDNISMQASSFGAQIRGGGLIEDNAFLDNNAGVNFIGGDTKDGEKTGQFTLLTSNVITSGAHKEAPRIGGLTYGIENRGYLSSLHDNIVAHLADPNNPDELLYKKWDHPAVDTEHGSYYDDTIVYNWVGSRAIEQNRSNDRNTDGVDEAIADQTTIQLYTAALLDKPDATVSDLSDYLRQDLGSSANGMTDADLITAYFQAGFGIETSITDAPADTLRFVPNDLGEGVRWDNRLNWDEGRLPGADNGDSVDLAGNWVNYGGTTTLNNLDFGSGGRLSVNHGYLEIAGELTAGEDGAEIDISAAGQFWTDGYTDDDRLDIDVDGGRFANTGDFSGNVDLTVTDGQAILATQGGNFDLGGVSRLVISGEDTRVGFDGTDGDTAVLRFEDGAVLGFSAQDGSLGTISEFRSGFYGAESTSIQSGVNLGLADLHLDLTGMQNSGGEYTLIEADEIIGGFGEIRVQGLRSDQDAEITVDYETDTVTLNLTCGSGDVSYDAVGDADDAQAAADLWAALTDGQPVYDEVTPLVEKTDEDLLDVSEAA